MLASVKLLLVCLAFKSCLWIIYTEYSVLYADLKTVQEMSITKLTYGALLIKYIFLVYALLMVHFTMGKINEAQIPLAVFQNGKGRVWI